MENGGERLLYDRKSAALALGISIRGLDYLIAEGKVRVRRLGKRVLVPRAELERLAAKDQPRIAPEEQDRPLSVARLRRHPSAFNLQGANKR